jgi:UDP-N-acetylmuramyl pentapeptide phosphotransferase/UDP-N-acetylglucosamine-1-phosphate transferase
VQLASVSLVLAAAVWGFFWINWPLGKIFLGDGGSYFTGFALAWVAVLLLHRNPAVSAFAALLVCVHPVTEVVFSIFRRKVRKDHPGMPDRLHFHSIFKRRYISRWFSFLSFEMRNSLAGLLVGIMTLTAIFLAQMVYRSNIQSAGAVMLLVMGYIAIYARMVRHHWISPLTFLLKKKYK